MKIYGKTSVSAQPFVKWAGGKRRLLPTLKEYIPPYKRYFEPFVGAGAMLFNLRPDIATINDVNSELINTYLVIRDKIEELITDMQKHLNTKEYFYRIRNIDRTDKFIQLSSVERASRLLYLNKTCFNGLYRVNQKNQFNAPFGYYKNPQILQEDNLRAVNHFLNTHNVNILNTDFEKAVATAKQQDFIYFDPPYAPLNSTSSFTQYSKDQFGLSEQVRLKEVVDKLNNSGCYVMVSNSSVEFIRELYSGYNIYTVQAPRSINSNGKKRQKIDEIVITNF